MLTNLKDVAKNSINLIISNKILNFRLLSINSFFKEGSFGMSILIKTISCTIPDY
jgi:hypothetical protein